MCQIKFIFFLAAFSFSWWRAVIHSINYLCFRIDGKPSKQFIFSDVLSWIQVWLWPADTLVNFIASYVEVSFHIFRVKFQYMIIIYFCFSWFPIDAISLLLPIPCLAIRYLIVPWECGFEFECVIFKCIVVNTFMSIFSVVLLPFCEWHSILQLMSQHW